MGLSGEKSQRDGRRQTRMVRGNAEGLKVSTPLPLLYRSLPEIGGFVVQTRETEKTVWFAETLRVSRYPLPSLFCTDRRRKLGGSWYKTSETDGTPDANGPRKC